MFMQPVFGLAREKHNKFFCKSYENDWGDFHFHSSIELYIVLEGEMEVTINHNRKTLKAMQMSAALSYDAHAYKTPEHSRSLIFIVPTYMCKDFVEYVNNKKVYNPFITDSFVVEKIVSFIQQTRKDHINPITLSGYIQIILGMVIDNLGFEEVGKKIDNDLASQMLFYINDNFKDDISLKKMSLHFGFSESYISRYFKECFNIGFNRYLNILRLKNVLLLMKEKQHNITYCAIESGFNSLRTFYRAFCEEFECTPKQYIQKNL